MPVTQFLKCHLFFPQFVELPNNPQKYFRRRSVSDKIFRPALFQVAQLHREYFIHEFDQETKKFWDSIKLAYCPNNTSLKSLEEKLLYCLVQLYV